MATSNSVDYSIDRDTLIKESMQLVGALGEGISPNATQIADHSRALNIMLKAWQAHGLQLWTIATGSITPVESQIAYTLGSGGSITEKPLKIVEVYLRDTSNNDSVLYPLSRNEYVALNNKLQEGIPTQWYYDVQRDSGTLSLWPAPDATAATYSLKVVYQSPIEDMDSGTHSLDFPQEWYEAVKYGLAVRLAPVYGLPYNDRLMLKREYDEILELAMSWDTEQESIFFTMEN